MQLTDNELILMLLSVDCTIKQVHDSQPEPPCENDEADLERIKEKILTELMERGVNPHGN